MYLTDKDGKWFINGVVKVLVEPSEEYLAQLEEQRQAQEEFDRNNPPPPSTDERVEVLEAENADLWYENIMLTSKVKQAEQEIADLWYQMIVGGVSNE